MMKVLEQFYCHVCNGGLYVGIEQRSADHPQYLAADMSMYGVVGAKVYIPLLTVKQIDAMIKVLENAKARATEDHYDEDDVAEPVFCTAEELEDVNK